MKVIITGASGMVGEGVLLECIQNENISEILVVGRKACGHVHPKLKEIFVEDFFEIDSIKHQLAGYDACYFCLGISSVGVKKDAYFKVTYELTMHFAKTILAVNKNSIFCYVSGVGTDSTEKGRLAWARVKGKTENDLLKLGFKAVYNFRPGILIPTAGMKNTLKYYSYFSWLFPVFKTIFSNSISTLSQLGLAMISVSKKPYSQTTITVKDIHLLSKKD